MQKGEQMKVRLPSDLKAFVADQADRYGNSQNAEIVRSVRERMERMQAATGEKFGDRAPAAVTNSPALQGGPITHGL